MDCLLKEARARARDPALFKPFFPMLCRSLELTKRAKVIIAQITYMYKQPSCIISSL